MKQILISHSHSLEEKIYTIAQLHYCDTDSFALTINTSNIIEDLYNLKDLFEFSNMNKNHEFFTMKTKKWLLSLK